MKETEKKVVNVEDSRIDTALETKPFEQCFELIKKYPEILTLDRLEKFIRRCADASDSKWKHEMRDFLNDRFDSHGRWHHPKKDYDCLWNHAIVLTMIECYYFTGDYDYDKLIYLVKKFDDGNVMRLGYQWFKNSGYSFERDMLYKLKDCFTPEYIQERLKEGYYREILTLAAIKAFELPKKLTQQQKEELRKHVFEVITANIDESNFSAADTYHKDRFERIETLFKQCPDLFTVENIVAVALSSCNLAELIYGKIPKEQRKISQATISKLLDDKRRCEKMILLIFWYHIRLSASNRERVYTWVKKTMSLERLIDGGHSSSERRTVDLLENLRKKQKITLSFDDFLDALIEISNKKNVDIEGYNEKKFMNKYFREYKEYSYILLSSCRAMTYQSSHVLIKSAKEGYNAVADQYGAFHEHLNGFDRGFFLRLLPRETKDLDVIDLGAGDGRMYTLLKKYSFKSYTACDIAEKLLKRHPGGKNVKKTVCDLDAPLPFVDETFDLSFCFFVLEHIVDLEKFFAELYRITKTGGTSILGYFLQRREFVWKANKDQFKVALYNHRIQDIEHAAEKAFFKVKLHEIFEKGFLLGWDIQLTKGL